MQDDGIPIPLSELTQEDRASIAEYKVRVVGYDEERGKERLEISVKLVDKRAALESLGKHLGLFAERHIHSGPGGGPVQIEHQLADTRALAMFILHKVHEVGGIGANGSPGVTLNGRPTDETAENSHSEG